MIAFPLRASPASTISSSQQENRLERSAASRREATHDTELVRRALSGEDDAFVEIIERYRSKMFGVAFAHLRDPSDAEEIAQDTFIRAHRGLARFRGDCSLSTWLHRIAVNLSRNRRKYNLCRHRQGTLSLDCTFSEGKSETVANAIASDAPSPARRAVASEFLEFVNLAIRRLSESQQEILMLRNGLNKSYTEIARSLGINTGTVKSRIARARQNLRRLLAEANPDWDPNGSIHDCFEPIRPNNSLSVSDA
jgi:RNA polymerase sigma-70 factor (ECF subfamily)